MRVRAFRNITSASASGRIMIAFTTLAGTVLFLSAAADAQPTPYDVINAAARDNAIHATPLRGGITMLEGSGGNIGVLSTPAGALLVDGGISLSRDKILGALRQLRADRPRYLVNTHWHWDHSDGNAWIAGRGAEIVATPGIARRLGQTLRIEEWGHTFTPVESAARPKRLVSRPTTLRVGDEEVVIRPYEDGHTDGDLFVYFTKADVLQTGDTFWNGFYPFIDYVAGGNIDGAIRQAEANVAFARESTLVIPGHGPVGRRADLIAFRNMLIDVRQRVAALKSRGMSADQVVAARPTSSHDGRWGGGVVNGELFTRLVYRGV